MVEMHDTTDGFYYTVSPPNQSALVEYYFSINNNYYNWTNPINTDEVFRFSIGRDMILPDVHDLANLPSLIDRSGIATVSVLATDNIGVDSVSLYWYYSFNPQLLHITLKQRLKHTVPHRPTHTYDELVGRKIIISNKIKQIDGSTTSCRTDEHTHSLQLS